MNSEENNEEEVWKHIVEHTDSRNKKSNIYLTSDYAKDKWISMFYDENSYWGLYSDKWRTLFNQGTLQDWSLY